MVAGIPLTALALPSGMVPVRASVLGATFFPDHGPSGATIVVGFLPLPIDCPTVHIYLSSEVTPNPPIISAEDPRLIRIVGSVSYRTGFGPSSTGSSAKTTTFEFRVRHLSPGVYSTYNQCVGGPADWSSFDNGSSATFTVDPGSLPATSTIVPSSVSDGTVSIPPPILIAGSLALSLLLWCWRWSEPGEWRTRLLPRAIRASRLRLW